MGKGREVAFTAENRPRRCAEGERMSRMMLRMAGVPLLVLGGGIGLAGQTPVVDPYSLPMVQAACGAEGASGMQTSAGSHDAEAALKPGMARVYVITETRGLFGSLGEPVRLGMDGQWFGVNHQKVYGYSYVDVTPGVHHLCVAAKVRGALPHAKHAVLLARVDAVAGQSNFFYNQTVRIAGVFTLRAISADDGAMYVQALPSSGIPKLWKTAEVQAACGADPNQMPSGPVPPPKLPGPAEAGKALVYFFWGIPQFGGQGGPIQVAVDRRWIGETQQRSYIATQMEPGVHRFCTALKLFLGMKPTLHVGQLDVVAGKTYFVDTSTLQPVERSAATVWLRRIAAMPKSDTPDAKALKRWTRRNDYASPDELRGCGLPAAGSTATAPTMDPEMGTPAAPRIFFLLRSDTKRLHRYNAVNAGLDGRWVASLRSSSWYSQPIATGQHEVCLHMEPRSRHGVLMISPDTSLYLGLVDAADEVNLYFESTIVTDEYGFDYEATRLDPDEGALLVAYYPRADTLPR